MLGVLMIEKLNNWKLFLSEMEWFELTKKLQNIKFCIEMKSISYHLKGRKVWIGIDIGI